MNRKSLFFTAFLLIVDIALVFGLRQVGAQQPSGLNANVTISSADPCQSNGTPKQSVALNVSSATTTQLIALSAGKQIFVCGFNFTMVGTAQTAAFEYGTGASCGTGTTLLTGTMADGTVSDIVVGMYPGSTVMTAPAGNALCILTTGTAGVQGLLTYVQQ
jgi:hypothetical protein